MARLSTELKSVQQPFIKHAKQNGWVYFSQEEAFEYRKGKEGRFFEDILEQQLVKLNADFINDSSAREVVQKIDAIANTIEGNKQVLEWIRGEKTLYDSEDNRERYVKVIDFENIENNKFHVTEEWIYQGLEKENRLDIVFLINGIPLAVIENKTPQKPEAMQEAIKQLKRYERETPEMMTCPQVFNITHLIEYFYGVTWNYSRNNIFNWKKELHDKPACDKRKKQITLKEAVSSFFDKQYFLTLLKQWILFFFKENELQKTILRQHQTRAIARVLDRAMEPKKSRGLIWHTQGSGKTFTMITIARIVLEDRPNSTVMIVIDRNELEGQLSKWIDSLIGTHQESGQKILIKRVESKRELQRVLDSNFRGLIVSMIHKFDRIRAKSCTRKDFYVLIDEAHRSVNKNLGTYLMAALPNATIFGFTGTPIDKTSSGKGTFKVFGIQDQKGYLDKYSIQESIEDGTTLKLRHIAVSNKMRLNDQLLEEQFLQKAESEGVSSIEDLNKVLQKAVKLKTFLKSSQRVDRIAQHISTHFKENVQPLGYKAFVVAVDREACVLYKKALDKYLPAKISHIVYSKGFNDSELLSQYSMTLDREKEIRKSFVKSDSNPQILIVTDKLLTGYDAPILYCMYLDKPMRDHILLQAIARVNRPYEDKKGIQKPCGLVMDFVGIFKSMHKALSFDSDEINAVIEDLDILLEQFKNMIEKDFKKILPKAKNRDDEFLEKLIYEDFADSEKRKKFMSRVKELETMYEILSPDKRLHPFLEDYQKIIEIYKILKNAYSEKTTFLSDLSHKTEKLIQEHSSIERFNIGKFFEINVETLKKIKKDSKTSDSIKIMNLIKSILNTCEKNHENPTLISIAQKAKNILERFKEDQSQSKEFLEELLKQYKEVIDAEEQQKTSGLDKDVFLIFWKLKEFKLKDSKDIALEIHKCFNKFEHFKDNDQELRQLKIEIYKLLMPYIDKDKMKRFIDDLLEVRNRV